MVNPRDIAGNAEEWRTTMVSLGTQKKKKKKKKKRKKKNGKQQRYR